MFAIIGVCGAEEVFEIREDKLEEDEELDDCGGKCPMEEGALIGRREFTLHRVAGTDF